MTKTLSVGSTFPDTDGDDVTIIAATSDDTFIGRLDGSDDLFEFDSEGASVCGCTSDLDLSSSALAVVGWVNVYRNGLGAKVFSTKSAAKAAANPSTVKATVKIDTAKIAAKANG